MKLRPNKETGISSDLTDLAKDSNSQQDNDKALNNMEQTKTDSTSSDISAIKQSSMDMQQKMSCQFDNLDSMLTKAENAQYSMAQQNKDMKRLLK